MAIRNPTAIAAGIRTTVYGGVTASVATGASELRTAWEAAFAGAMLADYVTWVLYSLVILPSRIWQGSYNCLVGLLFGWFLFQVAGPVADFPVDTIWATFVTFMLVLLVKLTYYGAKLWEEIFS